MFKEITYGSVCSGIEAAQIAFGSLGFRQLWSSEIDEFPCKVLDYHYGNIPNLGDMINLPSLISSFKYPAPDIFCGGTPCQAFSLAGAKNGLSDERGKLTMTFIDIANSIDNVRRLEGKSPAIILWENVEGILSDKSNAFGNFLAGIAGYEQELKVQKWSKSGILLGPSRNVAWRVLDAKYFGLPQQRRRLYLVAGGKDFRPEAVLFEITNQLRDLNSKKKKSNCTDNTFSMFESGNSINEGDLNSYLVDNQSFEFFREYTDCLYSAYGTKWNGNAAAYNGSLYIVQNKRLRRFTPLECERLMGFPDNYTLVKGASDTSRYKSIGNSWAVPVINWIGQQIFSYLSSKFDKQYDWTESIKQKENNLNSKLYFLSDIQQMINGKYLNTSVKPNIPKYGNLADIVQTEEVADKFYLSSIACKGIIKRKVEKKIKMNDTLLNIMSVNCKD